MGLTPERLYLLSKVFLETTKDIQKYDIELTDRFKIQNKRSTGIGR